VAEDEPELLAAVQAAAPPTTVSWLRPRRRHGLPVCEMIDATELLATIGVADWPAHPSPFARTDVRRTLIRPDDRLPHVA
jgi:hypothetical protein